MTENEAIKELETSINLAKMCTQNYERKREIQGYEMAINALKEIQKYRKIGTVEEFEQAKKYIKLAKIHGTVGQVIDACAEYEEIGTVEECRAAVEKQKAKKPMHVTNSYFGYQKHKEHVGYCPDCGHQVKEPYGCPNCLRKIDWSDEE